MQRYAAAVGEFEVEIMNRPEIDPRFVAVVAHQVRASLCYARTGEAVAVVAYSSSCAATRRGAAAKNAAEHGLVPPGRHVVRARLETVPPTIVFQASGKRRVIAKARERSREIPRVPDGVAYSRIQERRPSSESTIEMRSEEHTSELQSRLHLVCRLLLEKKKKRATIIVLNLSPL